MKLAIRSFLFAFIAIVIAACSQQSDTPSKPADTSPKPTASNTLYLELKDGRVEIELLPDLAPKHVERISTLANQGFYDGIVFHRVIEGFMAQTGDPTGTGRGGSDLPNLELESSSEPFLRGVIGMARKSQPVNSANSQFFIMLADGEFLNKDYTVFAKVTSGMEFVDKIARGEPPQSPDKIIKMRTADKF